MKNAISILKQSEGSLKAEEARLKEILISKNKEVNSIEQNIKDIQLRINEVQDAIKVLESKTKKVK